MSYFNLHLILQIILYNCLYIELSSFLPFPMHQFFNESIDNKILSKYVCSYNPVETKYCSCSKYSFMNNNWCIDVFWMDKDDFTLDTYMVYFEEKYLDMLARNNYLTCKPIIYPARRNHLVERVMMHSTYIDENNVRKKCLNETIGYGPLSVAVHDETQSNVYINEFCAVANKVKNFKRVEVLAICKDIKDIKINMTIDSSVLLEKLDGCKLSIKKIGSQLQQCASEYNECPEDNEYYVLCNAYIAPSNGHRNHHCYLCANRKNIDISKKNEIQVNDCRKSYESLCLFGVKYIFSNENGFYINYDVQTKNLSVVKFEYIFPAGTFYQAYKHRFDTKQTENNCCNNKVSCLKFKACCVDKMWNSSKRIDLDLYKELLINNSIQYKDHHCTQLIPYRKQVKAPSYFMITTCLSNATKVQIKACTTVTRRNAQSYMPVVGEDNYLYRNSFCAKCNLVYNFSNIKVKSTLNRFGFIFEIDLASEHIVRLCDINMPSNDTCPPGHQYHQLCKSFIGPTQSYRNIFCHLCNHPNDEITFSKCKRLTKSPFPWSYMITLNHNGQIQASSKSSGEPIPEFAKFFEEGCMGSECEEFKTTDNHEDLGIASTDLRGLCMRNKKYITLIVIKKKNRFWNSTITNLMLILNVTGYEFESKVTNNPVMRIDFNLSFDQIVTKYDELNSSLLKYNNVGLIISHKYESTVNIINYFMEVDGSKRHQVCQFVEKWNESKLASLTSCSVENIGTQFQNEIYFHHLLDRSGLKTFIGQCKKYTVFPKNCHINFDRNKKINGSLPSSSTVKKMIIKADDFGFPSWGTYNIECPLVEKNPNIHQIEGYVSNIGTFISIICYAFLIFTYRINDRLWNIPGKLVVALSSSLLVGDSMYLVAWLLRITGYNQVIELCKTVGVIMHISLVIAHALNAVIGFDMVLRFTRLNSRWVINNTKMLMHIIIGVISVSAVLVLISIICDHFHIVQIGYGSFCVPYKSKGRLYFYIIPVAFTFLLSLVCTFVVVFNIWKESRTNQKTFTGTVGRRNINLIRLTLKLTFALGLIEGVGFIQVIELNDKPVLKSVLSLLYSLLRSLRGLILVLVFVCRKDALQVYREKFKRVDLAIELETMEFDESRYSGT